MIAGLRRRARALDAAATRVLGSVRWHGSHHEVGNFNSRETGLEDAWGDRDWSQRAFTVGIGGPVGSGKTALVLALCRRLREKYSIGVVTNDIVSMTNPLAHS